MSVADQRLADAVVVIVSVLGGAATKAEIQRVLEASGAGAMPDDLFRAWCRTLGPFVRVQAARETAGGLV